MPRYFFDVEDGHRLFDATGFVCDDDTDAIIKAAVLAIGVSLDTPEDDPERRIAIINDAGRATRRAIRLRLSYLIQISRRAWRSPSYSAPEENAVRAIAEGARTGSWRPGFPVRGDHRFRWMTTTCSGRWRPGQQGCGRA